MKQALPNKELERTKGAIARLAAPFAAQFQRSADSGLTNRAPTQHSCHQGQSRPNSHTPTAGPRTV
jgi:hypothetical protein